MLGLSNKNKLIVNIAGLMIIGLILSTMIAYQHVKSQQQEAVQKELTLRVSHFSKELKHWVDNAIGHVEHYAAHLLNQPVQLSTEKNLTDYHDIHVNKLGVEYLGYVLDESGYYGVDDWLPPKGYDARKREWYINGKKLNKSKISHPYISISDRKTRWMAITVPLNKQDKFIGLASAHVKLDYMQHLLTDIDQQMHGDAFFVDCKGVMFSPSSENIQLAWQGFLKKHQLPDSGSASLSLFESGEHIFYIPKYYSALDGYIVYAISKNEIKKELYKGTASLLAKFLVVFILVVIILYFANRHILAPIFNYMELDSVTSLPNKAHFKNLLIANSLLSSKKGRLLIINMEHFNRLTATYPPAYIHLLQNLIKERIYSHFNGKVLLGSFSESRYIAYVEEKSELKIKDNESLVLLTKQLSERYLILEQEIYCTFRIGISNYPEHGSNVEVLIDNAFSALAHVSREQGSNYGIFTPILNQNFSDAQNIQNAITKALKAEEFQMVYQPQVNLISKEMFAVESLVRWYSTELNRVVSPVEFIPIAENTGIILQLGNYIVDTVLKQLAIWSERGFIVSLVSINVSPKQLLSKSFYDNLLERTHYYQLSPENIELEITETSLLESPEASIAVLNKLHQQGYRIAIDDFGTGYSSLGYLNDMPLQKLKIDRSFIIDIDRKEKSIALVKAIISMANNLKLDVLAEGVETAAEAKTLQSIGCDKIQGYLYSKPVNAEQLEEMVTNCAKSEWTIEG